MAKGGFSWKRALGVTAAKRKISKTIGIPLTKSGRQQKLGRMITGGGCVMYFVWAIAIVVFIIALI